MYFSIRDDDTCYFTKPEELELAYNDIYGPISLSVVPFSVATHGKELNPFGLDSVPSGCFDIALNTDLISYLKDNIKIGRYDILLHGYTHEYKTINNNRITELKWKSINDISNEMNLGKLHLEKTLKTKISCFVAPTNTISKGVDLLLDKNKLNYSGIIGLNDHSFSVRMLYNYINRWSYRLLQGIPRPKVYRYKNHKELVAYSISSFDYLKNAYHKAKKNSTTFVIYTHYWNLNRSNTEKQILKEIYNYCIQDGAELIKVSDAFYK